MYISECKYKVLLQEAHSIKIDTEHTKDLWENPKYRVIYV